MSEIKDLQKDIKQLTIEESVIDSIIAFIRDQTETANMESPDAEIYVSKFYKHLVNLAEIRLAIQKKILELQFDIAKIENRL